MLGFHVPGHNPLGSLLSNEASSCYIHNSQYILEIILSGSVSPSSNLCGIVGRSPTLESEIPGLKPRPPPSSDR